MTFDLAWTYAQVLSRLCIKMQHWIVSVNLMGIMWSEDDIEKSVLFYLSVLNPIDLVT